MAGVGTTKIFENDKINVWEFVLEPGETTPVHTHALDYVFYVLDGAPLRVFDGDGRELTTFDASTGSVFVLRMEGDDLVGRCVFLGLTTTLSRRDLHDIVTAIRKVMRQT